MKKFLGLVAVTSLVLVSCGDDKKDGDEDGETTDGAAEVSLCDCIEESYDNPDEESWSEECREWKKRFDEADEAQQEEWGKEAMECYEAIDRGGETTEAADEEEEEYEGSSDDPAVCDCVQWGKEMAEKMGEMADDMDAMAELEEEYKDRMEACEEMANGLSEDEMAELMAEAEDCD